jgi:hypothetical protein
MLRFTHLEPKGVFGLRVCVYSESQDVTIILESDTWTKKGIHEIVSGALSEEQTKEVFEYLNRLVLTGEFKYSS